MYLYGHAPNWSMVLLGRLVESGYVSNLKPTLGEEKSSPRAEGVTWAYGPNVYVNNLKPTLAEDKFFFFFCVPES